MGNRTLIKGAIVLTQDDELGELPNADILIEDDRIAQIGPDLTAEGADVIDATGDIVIPGFIDTHRHTWETSIRTSASPSSPISNTPISFAAPKRFLTARRTRNWWLRSPSK